MAELISVIVTTYNREEALGAVLRGLSRQTDRDFEIIVADDGSGPATRRVIEGWMSRIGVALKHVWQEDRGFRAAEARNRGIAESRGFYCVFLDGDCIPRRNLISSHRRLLEPKYFVTGNRALLSRDLTARVLADGLEPENWSLNTLLGLRLKRDINRMAPLLTLPLGPLRKLRRTVYREAPSCNLGVWKDDLIRVDGFDTRYTGWGFEDTDLMARLIRAGSYRKRGSFSGGTFHLWHETNDKSTLPDNARMAYEVERSDRIRAVAGLSTLTAAGTGAKA